MKESDPCKFFHHYRHRITEKDHGPTSIQLPISHNKSKMNVNGRNIGEMKSILLMQNELPHPRSSLG